MKNHEKMRHITEITIRSKRLGQIKFSVDHYLLYKKIMLCTWVIFTGTVASIAWIEEISRY
ncbi:MAG: hypothetical protein JKY33_05580 [Bacteroidia bacterium]|nr:hypothetical protein [Bacteroidia bacterium]MBN4052417.1 hypothetical protein [Sphingobacteriaceae bacterium AH-315-L07]